MNADKKRKGRLSESGGDLPKKKLKLLFVVKHVFSKGLFYVLKTSVCYEQML
ncbi:hypothetical protein Hdeb2414_s0012g00382901 [Helianthus debilis subsp. tardiflorus]